MGPLWWQLHGHDASKFFGYETAECSVEVAEIFKNATHTATRKYVYTVRIGDHELTEQFAEVSKARQAGSDALDDGIRP